MINKQCVDVQDGYQLVLVNGTCTATWKCLYHCQTCNGSLCLSCRSEYYMSGGRCYPDFTNYNWTYSPYGSYVASNGQYTKCGKDATD